MATPKKRKVIAAVDALADRIDALTDTRNCIASIAGGMIFLRCKGGLCPRCRELQRQVAAAAPAAQPESKPGPTPRSNPPPDEWEN
jgi:hypothetical protein